MGMHDKQLTLSIVIVNHNGHHFLAECIESIRLHVTCTHEVIIVDNASTDGSAHYIATHFPAVHLIKNDVNIGFAGGNNTGVRKAKGELVLLLNNDTRLLSSIDDAVAEFTQVNVGAVGAHLFYEDGRNQPSVGYEHTPLRIVLSWVGLSKFPMLPTVFRRLECAANFYEDKHDHVHWVSGAFLMTRRDLWHDIQGLDESYFMYMEDVEYCKQVRNLDFDIAYIPTVEVMHYEGGGQAWIGQLALIQTMRSYRLFLTKHYGSAVALLTGMFLSLVMAARVPFYTLRFKLKKSVIDSEKATAYAIAARLALSRQLE